MSAILPNLLGFTITQGSFHLRLRKVLGQGAYGVVYLAEDISSSSRKEPSHYAVKCLLKHPAGSEYARQQAREIAYHLALSHHPNVVTLHCVIEEEFYTFLVMDYCPGGDLFNTIIERAHFVDNDAAVKNMFLQLLDAVQTAHDLNIYHRDLKPENILCSADDEHLYLSDFGLATKSKLSNGFGCGSSFYMSPECIGVFSTKKPYSTASPTSGHWASSSPT
ncbi:Negative regulator of sexual conjugation and meiosis [Grifola frondosa]|uniref:Negative regulator of sexual conjugation and meiosis n=1 Tax=Grifola frondosa TaxID=5627 RepID=A0A1C7M269_GRIFR|nr:Negative regulator of sexual conjugation and meiosis [Grifola frondosa]